MDDDPDSDADAEDDPLRAFALACRAERDRLALQALMQSDRRFDVAGPARAQAERIAALAIGAACRPPSR